MKLTWIVLALVLLIAGFVGCQKAVGIGGWGPKVERRIHVTRVYQDTSGSKGKTESHYMVGSDVGVFEVDNGFLLGVWNADEIYSKIQPEKTYDIVTKGRKIIIFSWVQEYPYITKVSLVDTNSSK